MGDRPVHRWLSNAADGYRADAWGASCRLVKPIVRLDSCFCAGSADSWALRCRGTVQVVLLGYLLVPVMGYRHWWLLALFGGLMLATAAAEAASRPRYAYQVCPCHGQWGYPTNAAHKLATGSLPRQYILQG